MEFGEEGFWGNSEEENEGGMAKDIVCMSKIL